MRYKYKLEALDTTVIRHSPIFEGGSKMDETVKRRAQALLAQGKKVHAVKLVREQTGMGLREAKEYVDRL